MRSSQGVFVSALLAVVLTIGGIALIQGVAAQAPGDPPKLLLRSGAFDPVTGDPARRTEAAATDDLYLVQFAGPVQETWKAAVRAAGATLFDYVPEYAFLARIVPERLAAVGAVANVRAVVPYQTGYRSAPEASRTTASVDALSYVVQTTPDADLTAVGAAVTALGGSVERAGANAFVGYLHVTLPASQLGSLASTPNVVWISPRDTAEARNDVAARIIGVERGDAGDGVRQRLGLYGEGQIVSVVDTGLDVTHPDIAGRVLTSYCYGRRGPGGSFTDCSAPGSVNDFNGHGTHVNGSVAASGVTSGAVPATNSYTGTPAGLAPKAQVINESIQNADGGLDPGLADLGDLYRRAFTDGARISNNSWGAFLQRTGPNKNLGVYGASSQQLDQAAWELKDFLIMWAVGNDGRDCLTNATQTLADDEVAGCPSPDGIVDLRAIAGQTTAKNVLAVGAAENLRPAINATWNAQYGDNFSLNPIRDDPIANNANGMGAFSSRGPLNDGRISPQLTAPGIGILSMRTRDFVFSDTVSADPGPWNPNAMLNGGSAPWTFQPTGGRSGAYWNQTVDAAFPGQTALLTTGSFDVRQVGQTARISFWARWDLAGDNQLQIILQAPPAGGGAPVLLRINTGATGSGANWTFASFPVDLGGFSGPIDSSQMRLGFVIASASGMYSSSADVDEITYGPTGDFLMSQIGLTTLGSAVDQAYFFQSGSSMAAPVATGASALVREWLTRTQSVVAPSAALVKSVLLNGTIDQAPGQYGDGATREIPATRPNTVEGFGRINLLESLLPAGRRVAFADSRPGVATGETAVFTYTAGVGAFRATLAWTDFPSALVAERNLVNDLDLEVTLPGGSVVRGNVNAYPAGNPVLTGARTNCLRDTGADRCNTIEQVTIPIGVAGTYLVLVRGFNVPSGEPGGRQPFAIAVSYVEGAAPSATPTQTATAPAGATSTPTVPPGSTSTPTVPPGSTSTPTVPAGSTATPTAPAGSTPTPPAGATPTITPTPGSRTFLPGANQNQPAG